MNTARERSIVALLPPRYRRRGLLTAIQQGVGDYFCKRRWPGRRPAYWKLEGQDFNFLLAWQVLGGDMTEGARTAYVAEVMDKLGGWDQMEPIIASSMRDVGRAGDIDNHLVPIEDMLTRKLLLRARSYAGKNGASFPTWARAVAGNVIRDYFRRVSVDDAWDRAEGGYAPDRKDDAEAYQCGDSACSPEDILIAAEDVESEID